MQKKTLLYIGTENGYICLQKQKEEKVDHWSSISTGLSGQPVTSITIPAHNPNIGYAAVSGTGLFKTQDQGRSWRQILSANLHCMKVDPKNHQRLWAGLEPVSVYYSSDGGQNWQDKGVAMQNLPEALDWYFPDPPYQPRVSALALHPDEKNTILAGIQFGGLLRSTNGGQSWQSSDLGLDEDIHELVVLPNDHHIWLAATGDGMYLSRDGAYTWTEASKGLEDTYITCITVLPEGHCFISATGTPPGNWVENATSRLYHSTDITEAWQAISFDHPILITALTTHPETPDSLYLGTHNGTIFESQDQGQSWHKIWQSIAGIRTLFAYTQA